MTRIARRCARIVSAATLIATLAGCYQHIGPYRAKKRSFDSGDYGEALRPVGGSIYAQGARGLTEDERPARVGDLVVIQLDENSSASHEGNTALGRKSAASIGLSGGLVDLLQKAIPAVSLAKLAGLDAQSKFDGNGLTERKGKLSGTLPVRVRRVLPNDDLYLEGTKVVKVGNEEHHLYISGIVRQVDVHSDGTVASSRVADAEIEYTGRGDISDQQRQGWLTRILNKVSPF